MTDKIDISAEAVEHLAEAMDITLATLLGVPLPTLEAQTLRALSARLAEAEQEKLDAISTLDAWFDRRELGHQAVDQAVVDAASGYLRTSRVGGMSHKESDLILGVIQDMAHLALFADLFSRAAEAEVATARRDALEEFEKVVRGCIYHDSAGTGFNEGKFEDKIRALIEGERDGN